MKQSIMNTYRNRDHPLGRPPLQAKTKEVIPAVTKVALYPRDIFLWCLQTYSQTDYAILITAIANCADFRVLRSCGSTRCGNFLYLLVGQQAFHLQARFRIRGKHLSIFQKNILPHASLPASKPSYLA